MIECLFSVLRFLRREERVLDSQGHRECDESCSKSTHHHFTEADGWAEAVPPGFVPGWGQIKKRSGFKGFTGNERVADFSTCQKWKCWLEMIHIIHMIWLGLGEKYIYCPECGMPWSLTSLKGQMNHSPRVSFPYLVILSLIWTQLSQSVWQP